MNNNPSQTVLCLFAHPDDESFLVAGTLAMLVERGAHVTMVSATRGEAGEIRTEGVATRETLGIVREGELRRAMGELGIDDIRFLGYRDSGMSGTPENHAPNALAQTPVEEVAGKIRILLEELEPEIVFTFGPEGVYLHPDHVAIHIATVQALTELQLPNGAHMPDHVYFATTPRDWIVTFASKPGGPFANEPLESLERMGTPRDEISTVVDVASKEELKRRALLNHRTQIGDDDPLSDFDDDTAQGILCYEHFVRSRLSRTRSDGQVDPLTILGAP